MTAAGPPDPGSPDLGNTARLVSLTVADDADSWAAAGFTVTDGSVAIAGTTIVLTGRADDRTRRGVQGWTVAGLDAPATTGTDPAGSIDGLATTFTAGPHEPDDVGHPNGVTGIDHVVVLTPDLDRTLAAFAAVGLGVRRIRETESYGSPMRQAFLRLGPTIVEVVGGHEGSGQTTEEAPASFFGLALDVADLDHTAALLGEGMGGIKPAVQDGRRISTIRHKHFGMSVATALMDHRLAATAEAGA